MEQVELKVTRHCFKHFITVKMSW